MNNPLGITMIIGAALTLIWFVVVFSLDEQTKRKYEEQISGSLVLIFASCIGYAFYFMLFVKGK